MALLCPRPGSSSRSELYQHCLALACGESVLIGCVIQRQSSEGEVPPTTTASTVSMSCGSSPLACLSFSPSGRLLAACNDDKTLTIWKMGDGGWVLLGDRLVPKRATTLQFSSDDSHVLVADKTGEVIRYEVSNIAEEGKALLGHFSMLLDMLLSPSNSHVITCDRDEKIRVSNYPNSYNVETFCLGHTDFVSALCLCDKWPNLLVSGSGDGTVRIWEWARGQLLHTEVCSQAEQEKEPLAVMQVTCTHKAENPLVVVAMESLPELRCFQLHSDGRLVSCPEAATIPLTAPPWSCAFDWSDCLWVCLPDEQEPLVCYKPVDGRFRKLQHSDHSLLASLCNWEHFKGCVGKGRDYSQLRKRLFDNMSAYLTRKEERIRGKESEKHHEAESEGGEGRPRAPKTPRVEEETVASGLPQQTEF